MTRTVSVLAAYIEFAVHLRSNSNTEVTLASSSSSVEQKDGLNVPAFCGASYH
jgi:hypothetical protein